MDPCYHNNYHYVLVQYFIHLDFMIICHSSYYHYHKPRLHEYLQD